MTGQTPLPAECQLIRGKREGKIPRMSARAAARRARSVPGATGWSEGSWRRYESGEAPSVPADKLAIMALVTGALPDELTGIGRPDAAAALGTLMRQEAARPEVPEPLREALEESGEGLDGLLAEIVQALADVDGSDMLTRKQKAALRQELIAEIVRDVAERRRRMRAVLQIALPGK